MELLRSFEKRPPIGGGPSNCSPNSEQISLVSLGEKCKHDE